jgi:hypothetical protein
LEYTGNGNLRLAIVLRGACKPGFGVVLIFNRVLGDGVAYVEIDLQITAKDPPWSRACYLSALAK